MWTDITRKQHARKGLRLPSDLTDAEWAIFEPLMPLAATTGRPLMRSEAAPCFFSSAANAAGVAYPRAR